MFDSAEFGRNIGEMTGCTNQTFIVNVKYRQNATWQGTVTWVEEKQKASFRSVLELLKLMDSAIQGAKQQEDTLDFALDEENNWQVDSLYYE